MSTASVIVPTARGGPSLERLLASLHGQTGLLEVLVVANRVPDQALAGLDSEFEPVRVIRLSENLGYGRAVNLAAREARGDALVLLNDDCTCEPSYVDAIVGALDPAAGVTMAAGVMLTARDPSRIDTAGIEIGHGLLAFDYLNGEPVTALDRGAPDPLGPSGAAAALDREAFLAVGGFDENLFAYQEDVDLVLRMRLAGGGCRLTPRARGIHEHSGTLGSGSARKNYLMGFGRGYLLRKWRVLANPQRVATALAADAVICAGQVAFDRNAAGAVGRVHGYRAARPTEAYPGGLIDAQPRVPGLPSALRRRLRRRLKLMRRPRREPLRTVAILHTAEVGGPLRSLEADLRGLAELGPLQIVVPGAGPAAGSLGDVARVAQLDYSPLMTPSGAAAVARALMRSLTETVRFYRRLRRWRPHLVIVFTTQLPSALIAARLARARALVYAAEIHSGTGLGRSRAAVGAGLVALAARLANAILACSQAVAQQFPRRSSARVRIAYPPIRPSPPGDGESFRRRHGIPAEVPCLVVVGNVTRGRGQHLAIRALEAVRASAGDVRLALVGSTFDRPKDIAFERELRELLDELDLSEAVVFTGHEHDMGGVYDAASVLVNPAIVPESFGRAPCEALVAGRPVVATRVGAVGEVLDGVAGATLVAPGDPDALARATLDTLADGDAPVHAREGGETIARRFSPEQSAAAFEEAVRAILPDSVRLPD